MAKSWRGAIGEVGPDVNGVWARTGVEGGLAAAAGASTLAGRATATAVRPVGVLGSLGGFAAGPAASIDLRGSAGGLSDNGSGSSILQCSRKRNDISSNTCHNFHAAWTPEAGMTALARMNMAKL